MYILFQAYLLPQEKQEGLQDPDHWSIVYANVKKPHLPMKISIQINASFTPPEGTSMPASMDFLSQAHHYNPGRGPTENLVGDIFTWKDQQLNINHNDAHPALEK